MTGPSGGNILEVNDIRVTLGEVQVIKGLSMQMKPGEKIGLIGPNGHGKTTTMMSISGIFKLSRGDIRFKGETISGQNPQKIVELGIIHVPEGGHLYPEMTVQENLLMGAYPKRAAGKKKENLDLVFSLFPKLTILAKNKANTLSGGELRMLAVGRGLMGSPEVLMLDEPTLGLAPNLVEEMGLTLSKIGQLGTCIILSDENISLVCSFAQRAYFLENGEIKMEGPTEEVLANDHVRRTYLGIA